MFLKTGQIISLWACPAQFECSAAGGYGLVDTMTLANVANWLSNLSGTDNNRTGVAK